MEGMQGITFPEDIAEEAFWAIDTYIRDLPESARQGLGQQMLDYSNAIDPQGSPQSEFVREAIRWTGQSIFDGEWNSSNFNLSALALTAAATEFGTDALLGAAIGVGFAALFWAAPVAIVLPATIVGGYLLGTGNFGWLPLAAPFAGKLVRGWIIDAIKVLFGEDISASINGFYFDFARMFLNGLAVIFSDPLSLDLDGDGIELISLANSNVNFDLDGNGFAERTGWVASDDGILVRDGNRNGNVDNVAELFGSATQDGFAVLETYDDNHDGKIDAQDAVFADLKVWRDLNQNGVSEAGELFTLAQLGIQSISVQTQDATGTNQGHDLGVTGLFTRADGTTGSATSIYFQTDGQDSTPNETGFVPAAGVELLPQLPRSGNLHSIAWTATNDADFRADLTALVNSAGTLGADELRSVFEALLLSWAGADDVPEGSRGAWVDAARSNATAGNDNVCTLMKVA